jgi:UPF0271 protein
MYNRAARDPIAADAIADAVRQTDPALALLGLAGSSLLAAGRSAGLRSVPEAFLDRLYAADGTLVPRDRPGAVLEDADAVARQALDLVREHRVAAADGSSLSVQAESYCVHGDSRQAAGLLRAVRTAFARAHIAVAPFAR